MPAHPIGSSHGFDLFQTTSLEVTVWRGSTFGGGCFPVVVAKPDDEWFAHKPGAAAVKFSSRHQALAWLLGGCPDCLCEPGMCDGARLYCDIRDCRACLAGCPENTCDMTTPTAGRD